MNKYLIFILNFVIFINILILIFNYLYKIDEDALHSYNDIRSTHHNQLETWIIGAPHDCKLQSAIYSQCNENNKLTASPLHPTGWKQIQTGRFCALYQNEEGQYTNNDLSMKCPSLASIKEDLTKQCPVGWRLPSVCEVSHPEFAQYLFNTRSIKAFARCGQTGEEGKFPYFKVAAINSDGSRAHVLNISLFGEAWINKADDENRVSKICVPM